MPKEGNWSGNCTGWHFSTSKFLKVHFPSHVHWETEGNLMAMGVIGEDDHVYDLFNITYN